MDWQVLIRDFTVLLAGVLGVCLLLAWNVYVRKTQEKALLQTFIQEFLLLYKRCTMYYGQMTTGAISYSTLFEISDAGMVTKLAETTNEPPIIETVMQLKADFFQVVRWAHMMSKAVETTVWRTEPDPNNPNRKIRIKQTTTISAPDPEAQSKAMVFFVGEATSTDNFRETYKDYRKKISALLDYLEQLNSKRDYGYLPLIIDRIRGRTTALKKLIDDSRVSLDESTEQIEKVREKERQVWERERQKSS
jgi:hypothetical protein